MKSSIVVVALACLWLASSDGSAQEVDIAQRRWDEYKTKYNKSYSSPDEESMRFELFFERLREVVDHNAKTTEYRGYKMGINHLSDLTPGEFKIMNGLKVRESLELTKLASKFGLGDEESVDWRTSPHMVGPVKDQGHCGSCWAFATTGLLEGQEHVNSTGTVVELSEQNLVDCDKINHGCAGGEIMTALQFIKEKGGIETEQQYPYISSDGTSGECKFKQSEAFITTRYLDHFYTLADNDEKFLKLVVAKYGPVAVGIDAQPSLAKYQSGVYHDEKCSKVELNHAILIVGFGTTDAGEDYWIIKNSWSEHWGMKGYALMARGKNTCGIASQPIISIAKRP